MIRATKNPLKCTKIVNFKIICLYFRNLQERLIPIRNFTINDAKKDLSNTTVLVMPSNKGHFTLALDINGIA